ncbi:unnamed protein product [Alopecurus aequalis]
MRRRRWARAAALCLAIAVVLQLAVHSAGAAVGTPLSRRERGGTPHKGLPAPPASSQSLPLKHASVPRTGGGAGHGVAVSFDAAARCKNSTAGKSTAVGLGAAACAGVDDDDKRVVPTGPNPLHNR